MTGEKDLKIKESPSKGVYVDGLSNEFIQDLPNFYEVLEEAQSNKFVAGTKLNSYSSRSHTILILEIIGKSKTDNIMKKGILNLVDLAGSEKISKTGAVGEVLEEAKKINLSLSCLGNVIHALTESADFIPYRDSKLTRLLQESLGGNYKTSLIVTCSPHSYNLEETISSLNFGMRAKTIKNKVKMNIKLSEDELNKIILKLKSQLEQARLENSNLLFKYTGNNDKDSKEANNLKNIENDIQNVNLIGSQVVNEAVTEPSIFNFGSNTIEAKDSNSNLIKENIDLDLIIEEEGEHDSPYRGHNTNLKKAEISDINQNLNKFEFKNNGYRNTPKNNIYSVNSNTNVSEDLIAARMEIKMLKDEIENLKVNILLIYLFLGRSR